MNAITPQSLPDAEERTARHLATCRELAELAMDLARAAARRTLQAWQEQEAPPEAATEPPENPAAKTPDPGLLFARLSTAARHAITLEARIAAGPAAFGVRTIGRATRPANDERRNIIRPILDEATEHHPDRAAFRKEIAERLEEEIAADIEGEIPVGEMLGTICEDLGIEINWSKIQDEVLEKITGPINLIRDGPK